MSKAAIKRIEKLGAPGLRTLWAGIVASNTPKWQPGKAMEFLILRAFQIEGASVTWPYTVKLEGTIVEQIDGAIQIGSYHCLVECKDSSEAVNIAPLAKLRNQLLRRPSFSIGLLFSRGGLTAPAQTLAQFMAPQTILTWSGPEIKHLLNNGGFLPAFASKLKVCVEHGITDFDTRSLP